MWHNLSRSMSSNPFFNFLAGVASLVSLIISIQNEQVIVWIMLILVCLIFLLLLYLIQENSNMLSYNKMMIGEMNSLKLDVFNSEIELGLEGSGNFSSNSDLTIVISSTCTPDIMEESPTALVKLQYPSQLKMKFVLGHGIERLSGHTNNTCTFKVPLGKGNEFIGITSIKVHSTEEQNFKQSSKMIEVNVISDNFEKRINLNKSIPIADVGW